MVFHLNWKRLICVESPKTQKTLFVRLRRKAIFQQTISWRHSTKLSRQFEQFEQFSSHHFIYVRDFEWELHSFIKRKFKKSLNSPLSSNLIILINFIHYIATFWWTLHKLMNFVVFHKWSIIQKESTYNQNLFVNHVFKNKFIRFLFIWCCIALFLINCRLDCSFWWCCVVLWRTKTFCLFSYLSYLSKTTVLAIRASINYLKQNCSTIKMFSTMGQTNNVEYSK